MLPPLLDPRRTPARGSGAAAGRAAGTPIRLGMCRHERVAALADAGAPAAIDAATGIGQVASGHTTNATQQRLTPGLHIRLPH
ncbi:hypothetical protein [Xanthomonas bonasiae]|uniref:hypothetical protein n=1 Tax=Xanthomonas bonasiae TaxID=2810351 RepID=UPI00177F855E|nr:hypothetical protein [Xanthomonas surreyensis]MBD7920831.1 hypothetical protein [Xanthomonas surreyensis]